MAAPLDIVPPVYIKCKDTDKNIAPIRICEAVTQVIHASKLLGVQKINNLWLIYMKDKTARLEFCVKGSIIIDGKRVTLYDQNPNTTLSAGNNSNKQMDKLTIKHVPLWITNDEISEFLQQKNVVLKSSVRNGLVRELDGQFTSYLSGDRYVYVEPFNPPLEKQQKIGDSECVIMHHGKMSTCSACGKRGHKITESTCEAKPKHPICAFRGYQHPLSNLYPCEIAVFGLIFKSIEHAYLYRMLMELGHSDMAERVRNTKHAGEAKRVCKEVINNDEKRWEWEESNTSVMKSLLLAKAEQCPEFVECLIENKDKVLAEATPNKLWGSGLSPFVTENTDPEFWPGRNVFGALLSEITSEIELSVATENVVTEHMRILSQTLTKMNQR